MKLRKALALLLCMAMILAFAGCTISIEVTDPSALAMLASAGITAAGEDLSLIHI